MKKQNEKNSTTEVKVRRQKKMTTFFLYNDAHGFLRGNGSSMPNFDDGELIKFNTRSKANFARDFFLSMGVADTLDIFAKVG